METLHTNINRLGDIDPLIEVRRVGMDSLETIRDLNVRIFNEQRVINSLEREDLVMLLALINGVPIGFKVGYRENRFAFYSAKGGVLEEYRGRGAARAMLYELEKVSREKGYKKLAYDTFPNIHSGMTVLGLAEGYRVVRADFNSVYKDFRLRFEKRL